MKAKTTYVFDTSALLTLYYEEEGADSLESILRSATKQKINILISFISITEFYYILYQRSGIEKATQALILLKTLPLNRMDPDEELLILAGILKAEYFISLADAFIAALALQKKALLIHKDPEYEALQDKIELMPLPYKSKS